MVKMIVKIKELLEKTYLKFKKQIPLFTKLFFLFKMKMHHILFLILEKILEELQLNWILLCVPHFQSIIEHFDNKQTKKK